ncbi:factor VIII intron 22 protein [Strongylocentrotus purpuratus]|uniref:Factor VIII intron 22 protein n=1 Tax=Strongylocentrotus purpuratus TaxID=7668 RepID=A0A7M7SYH3_STRPU|nr:factor VIII intron 22 protein-like [Strongylocentrotus purpuratus]XP_030855153.1 factor VIII intron 22 protein [Strongylocentrotus purpuratus]|eukprot:XP_783251.3 PREDICTED: factor VIII intron 22 protein [Strongylocentrotus purpuratus]
MDRDSDYLGKYRAISGKLKKRFLRKPNVAEAADEFGNLAKVLHNQECPSYAALFSLAKARCEHTLANHPAEVHALVEAAHEFLDAEWSDRSMHCPNFEENLCAAINCYNHAVRVSIEHKQPALSATLCLQLGNSLRRLKKPADAMGHYQKAAELQYQCPLDCLHSLGKVASCKIEIGDFDGALAVLTEMEYLVRDRGIIGSNNLPIGSFSDILASCEISRVLLLMLLQPTPQRIRPEHAQTLEKYTWESDETNPATECITEEVFLLLQSVVMACQSKDAESLKKLQADLWCHLSAEQNHILHLVLEQIALPPQEASAI